MKTYYAVFINSKGKWNYSKEPIQAKTKNKAENIAIERKYKFNLITKRKEL